ncbi:uncharacterized protein EV420DRAFT_864109 [Desarmillaria tabescens]|uniref:Uncharacterized protein n=1 Tax=Armillaria tabescens TaxID=1929756 RepID=A0AA39JUW6_ARMTA|nr:uncharacterized protein EV420DRAFT_864109 [Desarmillaria tabescens]KAK0447894.1 hypothetical protein EV420DRAFT_864109 [Desarmillaria tabescens]
MAREPSNALITIFIVMHTFGWTGSSLILLTVLCSTKVSRCLTWFNLNFSWIVACLSFSLLFITGQLGKSSPDAGVCLMQASAVSAAPTLTAGATLAFVIFLFFELRSRGIEGATFSILLISLPYLFPTIIFSLALVHGIRHPRSVILSESKMFCTIDYRILDKAATIFTCTIMLPTLTLNIVIGFLVQQYWRILPRDKRNGVLSSCVRLAIFTVFSLVGVVINVMFLTGLDWGAWSGLPNLLISLASVSYVAVFGSQRDLLEVWFPCIRNHKDNKVVEPPPSTTSWVQLIPTNFVHGHNVPV